MTIRVLYIRVVIDVLHPSTRFPTGPTIPYPVALYVSGSFDDSAAVERAADQRHLPLVLLANGAYQGTLASLLPECLSSGVRSAS